MRKVLPLAAFSCALAGPALAADVLYYPPAAPPIESPVYSQQSIITGDVALAIGYYTEDDYDTAFGLASGRVNIPIGSVWNLELEVGGLTEFNDDGYDALGVFGHGYWKTRDYALGALVGGSSLSGDGVVTAGIEGAVFLPSASVLGHLSYSWGSGGVPDFWTVSGEGRWYWNPNTKLFGVVTYADYSGDSWMLTAGAEHRFDGTQFSLFGSASYFTHDGPDAWEVLAGGRIFFDPPGSTLQQYDWNTPFAAARTISF